MNISKAIRFLFTVFVFMGAGSLIAFTLIHSSFYFISGSDQTLHPHYDYLRSSGYQGLSFGLIGTLLIFLNLTYLLRRSLINIEWLGALRNWMAFHVFTGMVGGGLILLHSAFHLRSLIGTLSFIGLIITVLTGLIGRYFYSQVPRSIEGKEMELEEIKNQMLQTKILLENHGFHHPLFSTNLEFMTPQKYHHGFFLALKSLQENHRAIKENYKSLKKSVLESPTLGPMSETVLPLAKRFVQAQAWLIRFHDLHSLMSNWRFSHRWFAILMLISVIFHVFVAIQMGDLWIFKYVS